MMKSYQLSVISCQRISNQRSGRIFFQKILSAVSKRGLRLTKASLLMADGFHSSHISLAVSRELWR